MRGLQFGEQSESPIERAPRADDMRAESKNGLTAHAHVRCTCTLTPSACVRTWNGC